MSTSIWDENRAWHKELAESIRSGRFCRAAAIPFRGVYHVVGIGPDEVLSPPFAKYSDPRRAEHAVTIIHHLAGLN